MKKDIQNRADIELLVNTFYERVIADEQLGSIFSEIANVNWSTHLPAMVDFWENIIFYTGTHEGNPMNLYKHLHQIRPLDEADFDKWNQLFIDTVEELFKGKNADMARQRAIGISGIIRAKYW